MTEEGKVKQIRHGGGDEEQEKSNVIVLRRIIKDCFGVARCFSISTVSTVFECVPLTAFPWWRHLSPWKPWWTPYDCISLLSGWYQANVPGLLGYWTRTLLFWLGPQLSSSLQECMQLCTCVDMDTGSRWLRNRYKIQTGGLEPISFPEPNQGSHFLRAR